MYNFNLFKKSQKIFNEKIDTGDPAYVRLYNQKKPVDFYDHKEIKITHSNIEMAKVEKTINNLYKKAMNKKQRIKELEEKIYNEIGNLEINSLISSNKIIIKKFISQYKTEIQLIEKNMNIENKTIDINNNSLGCSALNNSTHLESQSIIQMTNQSLSHDIKDTGKNKLKITQVHLSKY